MKFNSIIHLQKKKKKEKEMTTDSNSTTALAQICFVPIIPRIDLTGSSGILLNENNHQCWFQGHLILSSTAVISFIGQPISVPAHIHPCCIDSIHPPRFWTLSFLSVDGNKENSITVIVGENSSSQGNVDAISFSTLWRQDSHSNYPNLIKTENVENHTHNEQETLEKNGSLANTSNTVNSPSSSSSSLLSLPLPSEGIEIEFTSNLIKVGQDAATHMKKYFTSLIPSEDCIINIGEMIVRGCDFDKLLAGDLHSS